MKPDQIKAIRKSLKLSRREFGERLGVTGQAVQNWETGLTGIGKQSIILIENHISDFLIDPRTGLKRRRVRWESAEKPDWLIPIYFDMERLEWYPKTFPPAYQKKP